MSQGIASPCVPSPLTEQAISRFKSDPKAILSPNSDTRTIEGVVADLASTDASVAPDLVRLAAEVSPALRLAIAAGLARAATACSTVDQHAALIIQQAVAGFDDGAFQSAFASVAEDLSTAATSAALSSATSSVGSVVIVNPNRSPGSPKNPGGGGRTAIFQINSGGVAAASRPGTSSSTAASPVSATR
ncbi:hypothetical protein HCN50_15725 [Bradyrhizobium sp. WSM 1744]|uniref:Uncharacterized protein n=1 Tax=Bradyrhizobium archetypum TaxID=2721160 RepID=A0A7Y4H6L9_9BRAD|nr:hypothetical protein [Bradyrhizobium archetypum]